MSLRRYRAEDLVEFGKDVLVHPAIGYLEKQAYSTAKILVEADLRGDPDHGIIGGTGIGEIYTKVNEDAEALGFKRICTPAYLKKEGKETDFTCEKQKYPTLLFVNANGLLGHYVTLEILPKVIHAARQYGYAKAHIRNSTHFGNCGIYSEMIAQQDLAAKVTSTSPAWTKPFIALQTEAAENSNRYDGVKKRFGTNPIAWSIPYDQGIVTIDMAATQRAVSPPVDISRHNAQALGITHNESGQMMLGKGARRRPLRDVHLELSRIDNEEALKKELARFDYPPSVRIIPVEKGLLVGPDGEDITFPLAFDEVFKENFWIAPLGGTYFGYKGFGLNMLIELDNVLGGGEPSLIRELDSKGRPTTPERVSHTIEVYTLDGLYTLEEAKQRLGKAVQVTIACGNKLMFLPGEKEQRCREEYIKYGIPMAAELLNKLRKLAEDIGIPFNIKPVEEKDDHHAGGSA